MTCNSRHPMHLRHPVCCVHCHRKLCFTARCILCCAHRRETVCSMIYMYVCTYMYISCLYVYIHVYTRHVLWYAVCIIIVNSAAWYSIIGHHDTYEYMIQNKRVYICIVYHVPRHVRWCVGASSSFQDNVLRFDSVICPIVNSVPYDIFYVALFA